MHAFSERMNSVFGYSPEKMMARRCFERRIRVAASHPSVSDNTDYVNYALCPRGKQAWIPSLAPVLGRPLPLPALGRRLPVWARWVGVEAV